MALPPRATARLLLALLVVAAGLIPATLPDPVLALESVPMPFPGGTPVKIIQGYNGGTHQGRSRYGLDLVVADGQTAGAEVVSPIEGTVTYAQAPKVGNGCMGIATKDGSYSVMLCHVIWHRTFSRGESIERGQTLGTVGPAGTVGNNGAPHVHMELHRGSGISNPVPFAGPSGLPLEGIELAATGGRSEHGSRAAIASSNRGGSVVSVTTTLAGREPATAAQAPVTAATLPSSGSTVVQPTTRASATAGAASRAATVQGTESCLKVRKQPAADAAVLDCVAEGSEVKLAAASGDAPAGWSQLASGGWVSSQYVKQAGKTVKGTGDCLNVRAAASASAKLLGCLADGTAVTVLEGPKSADGHSWYRIAGAGSVEAGGWVVGKYLD